jgi:galactosyltransferase
LKILFAIVSCNDPRYYPEKTQTQRETWVQDIEDADYKFFFGQTDREPLPDEVILDCPDDYDNLHLKTWAILVWAYKRGYDAVVKCDDDTYVFPKKLLASGVEQHDYAGCYIPGGEIYGIYYPEFAGGGCYWLSKKAIKEVLDAKFYWKVGQVLQSFAEDRNIGYILHHKGVRFADDGNHTCMTWVTGFDWDGTPMRLTKKPVVAVHTCTSDQIRDIHSGKETLEVCYTRQV